PPHILVTTPESLALVLASRRMRPRLAGLRWVVVDEVHALAGTKRGAHLALTLERLERAAGAAPSRVGLSATVAPLGEVARHLAGDRPCEVLDAGPRAPPTLRLALARDEEDAVARIRAEVEAARTTLVFAPTRASAEAFALATSAALGDAPPDEEDEDSVDPEFPAPERHRQAAPHHGSMSREARAVVEARLSREELRCVVTSSSLELGVHLDAVDRVVQLGSPRSVARAVQRVGRSGHRVGGQSVGLVLCDDADDLVEAAALASLVAEGRIEEVDAPRAALDVLGQHLVALALEAPFDPDEAFALARRAHAYRGLARDDFDAVLDALLGARRPLLARSGSLVRAAGGRARMLFALQGSVIPEAATVKAFAGDRYVGELDEGFLSQLSEGDVLQLAGEAWRFLGATGDRVRLGPARGHHPTVPTWKAEGPSTSPLLAGRAARFRRPKASDGLYHQSYGGGETEESLRRHLARQAAFQPLPEGLPIEVALTDEGARAVVVHLHAGRRATEALARALAHRLGEAIGARVRPLATDAGFALLAPRAHRPTRAGIARLFAPPLAPSLVASLEGSQLLRRRFRHVATRLFLLPKDELPPGGRQQEANRLLARLPADHPAVREAWTEALRDALDLDAAERIRADVASGALPLALMPARPHPSPFAARILHPPEAFASPSRRAQLADMDERVDLWLEIHGAEKKGGPAGSGG
ncbi:MAG TPA: helicase-related protein, partial [Candidatus Thermoplasmatota archaeon]|nr:helicase-related protein [Candidatus Thermoplasmatota archaeon]